MLSSQAVGEAGWLINSSGKVLRGSTLGKNKMAFLTVSPLQSGVEGWWPTCQGRCCILELWTPRHGRSSSTSGSDGWAWCWSWLSCCLGKGVDSTTGGNYRWQCCGKFCSHVSSCSHLQGYPAAFSKSLWAPDPEDEQAPCLKDGTFRHRLSSRLMWLTRNIHWKLAGSAADHRS